MSLLYLVFLVAMVTCQLDDWDEFELVWEDNFDSLDPLKWEKEITAAGGGNGEFQVYLPDDDNSYTEDGYLVIKPTLLRNNTDPRTGEPFGEEFFENGILNLTEMYGRCTSYCLVTCEDICYRVGAPGFDNQIPPIASARLRTSGKFSFSFGRVVTRAQMPVGDWIWPAIWMLPEDYVYGVWPRSGEIDIIEIIGNEDFVDDGGAWRGIQRMGSTIHWGPDIQGNRFWLTRANQINESVPYARNFHEFIFDWSELGMRWYVDGALLLSVPDPLIDQNPDWAGFWDYGMFLNPNDTNPWAEGAAVPMMAPFDQDFHVVINVAVGGVRGYIPDGVINRQGQYPKPWNNTDTQNVAFNKFRFSEADWYWTWDKEGEDAAMKVDYMQVYQRI